MLPDFPHIKRTVLDELMARSRLQAEADPVLGMMPSFIVHEGSRINVHRQSGPDSVVDLRREPITSVVEITADEVRRRGPSATTDAVARLAAGLNEGLAKTTFAAIEEAAASVGNSVKANGQFTAETYFAAFERIEHDFDASGEWRGLKLLAHPDTAAKAEPILEMIEKDPELSARRAAIIARKREEWRVREASRQLVD